MKRVAIYLRVSTDKQTTNNQRRELEAVAERSGWQVVKVYSRVFEYPDNGSGSCGAKTRPYRTLSRSPPSSWHRAPIACPCP